MTDKSPFESYDKDQKNRKPLEHYAGLYKNLNPQEIERRCNLSFDEKNSAFSLRILGKEHRALYPQFALMDVEGETVKSPYENILFLRYLCEGKYFPTQGKQLSYNEIPWGNVYYRNFEGRCLKRCAMNFGKDIPAFKNLMEKNPQLRATDLGKGDAISHAGYRFEFLNGLFVSILLWGADDEFPPSAQMLFDDNFVFAFTAEDIAVVGEVIIEGLKNLRDKKE
jgi:hypothetical protein